MKKGGAEGGPGRGLRGLGREGSRSRGVSVERGLGREGSRSRGGSIRG